MTKIENGELIIPDGADVEVYKAQVEAGEIEGEYKKPADEHIDEPGDKTGKEDGDSNADDLEDKDDDEDKKTQINRTVESIPAWKAKEMAKKAAEDASKETEARLTADFQEKLKAASSKEGGATDEEVTALADEFGIKPELVEAFATRLAGVVQKNIKVNLSAEDRAALDTVSENAKQAKENAGFEKEWGDAATQTALTAVSGGKPITDEIRNTVRKLAYTSGYTTYRLADIIALEGSKLFPKGSKSAESARGGASRGQASKTIDEMSPEEVLNMSDDEFKTLSDELGGKGSRFIAPKKK